MSKNWPAVVLMYHRINDVLPAGELVVPAVKFRRQMEYLKQYCSVIGIEELTNPVSKAKPFQDSVDVPRLRLKKVVVTFDDGYRDNYLNAYPILKELGLPAMIFLTTGYIGTLKKRPRYKDVPWRRDYLNWREVKEMAKCGIEFGAHTVSHPHLSQLGPKEQKREIEESVRKIGIKAFCYPYGEYNKDTMKILKELGVEMAFTVQPGINQKNTDPLKIKRIGISGLDSMAVFKSKICKKYATK